VPFCNGDQDLEHPDYPLQNRHFGVFPALNLSKNVKEGG